MADRVRMHWTKRREAVFLRILGETCNVSRSCKAAGLAYNTVYRRKKIDPAFGSAWDEALARGYATLEEALLARALAALEVDDAERAAQCAGDAPRRIPGAGALAALTPVDVQLVLALLNRHRATVEGRGKPVMADKGRRATAEETDAALNRKLDALARRLKVEGAVR